MHRYVTLVGAVLAPRRARSPTCPGRFIVLDTDARQRLRRARRLRPHHRGRLALMPTKSELAGVLGHEIDPRHRGPHHQGAVEGRLRRHRGAASGKGGEITACSVDQVTAKHRARRASAAARSCESDREGLEPRRQGRLRAARACARSCSALTDRNKNSTEKRGLFASHPAMQERLDKLAAQEKKERASTVTLEARYQQFISYKPVPQSQIATVAAGSSGLASGSSGSTRRRRQPTRTPRRTPAGRRSPRRRASAWAASPAASAAARRSRARRSPRVARAGSIPRSTPRAARTPPSSASTSRAPTSTPSGRTASWRDRS